MSDGKDNQTVLVGRFFGGIISVMNLISLNQNRTFTYREAQQLLPIVFKITESAFYQVKTLIQRAEAIRSVSVDQASKIENDIQQLVDNWYDKMSKLGAKPKGLWLADFDNGKGYFCWKFPETELTHWHGYNDGFSARKKIDPVDNPQ